MLTVSGSIYIATNGSEEEDMKTFLDIGIFNSFAPSNRTSNLSSSYDKREKEKRELINSEYERSSILYLLQLSCQQQNIWLIPPY